MLISVLLVSSLAVTEFVRIHLVKKPLTRTWYVLSLLISALTYPLIVFTAITTVPWSVGEDLDLMALAAFRWFVVLVVVLALLGYGQQRLAMQVQRANEATAAVLSQKEILVRSEEFARRSVADFLHDRVQSMLVTTTMQVRAIAQRTDDHSRAELLSVAEYLDDLRATEVREANTRLSPNITVQGLEISLRQLMESLNPHGENTVTIGGELDTWIVPSDPRDVRQLGVYRIIEQAAANAVIHGHATRIDVHLARQRNRIVVSVTDNGSGVIEDSNPGSGTAVIDSWAQILGGEWVRQNLPSGGVEVHASFPLQA
jgi:signal transduction histidine kinase